MPYPEPGTYESAYQRQLQPYGYNPYAPYPTPYQPYPPPYPYGPPPWIPQGGFPQGAAPWQQPSSGDLNSQLLGVILPIITTLPQVRNGAAVAEQLRVQLAALQDPPAVVANPTQADYNKLVSYAVSVKNAVAQTVGNDSTVFSAIKQGILLSSLSGLLGGAGGGSSTLLVVLLLAFSGGLS